MSGARPSGTVIHIPTELRFSKTKTNGGLQVHYEYSGPDPQPPVFSQIDGNQSFTSFPPSPDFEEPKRGLPAPPSGIVSWTELVNLRGFREKEIWKAGIVEFWGSLLNSFISGAIGIALGKNPSQYSPMVLAVLGGMSVFLTLPLLIQATGPGSGGHINSMITLGTFAARLITLPRAVVYLFCQNIGSVIGGYLLRVGLGSATTVGAVVPGCYWDPGAGVTDGQAFVIEFASCCAVLFIGFGVGLDPGQRDVFGAALGPILIGVTIGVMTWITGIIIQGYTGASMNPSRCFGLLAATQVFRRHWIMWLGPIAAAAVNGLFYWAAPPNHASVGVVVRSEVDKTPFADENHSSDRWESRPATTVF